VTFVTVYEDLRLRWSFGRDRVCRWAYAWNNARRIHAKTTPRPTGAKSIKIQGPLFFGVF